MIGPLSASKRAKSASDFVYVEDLVPFIYDNYLQSDKYKDGAEFFPEILKYLKNKYPQKN